MSTPATDQLPARRDERPGYGIDAPPVIGVFAGVGVVCAALGAWLAQSPAGWALLVLAAWSLLTSALFVLYALFGKYRYRDTMLAMVDWSGAETVLDVGTGRGFLLAGAAKRLRTGKAYGIDVWSNEDLSRNSHENCTKNLVLEGVADRAEVRSEDARALSFAAATFDVVLSNLCLHNIHGPGEREKACREIARVLKPNGVALISDFKNTADYAREFRAAGLEVSFGPRYWLGILAPFPLRVVRARKA